MCLFDVSAVLRHCAFEMTSQLAANQRQSDVSEQQELSHRKQIARQLRTQFVDGISVALKSTLRVTQGHWKRNHWTDHTRLTIRRVIGR